MIIPIDESFVQERDKTEQWLFAAVRENTPKAWRIPIFPQDEVGHFTFRLNATLIERLKLWEWFDNYKKAAQVSTAGIRGAQNILYPWDTRFPINQIGVVLTTLGKSLVARENAQGRLIRKIAACEVRYNSTTYVELIARIQAAQGIQTLVPRNFRPIPIWMVSFLIFVLDLDGGEHITSSHSVSTKNATKDLDSQGSQYLPEESTLYVDKVEEILTRAESEEFRIDFSPLSDENIDFEFLDEIHDGTDLYTDYLKNGVANDANLNLIREVKPPIVVDCVGGCMYRTMQKIFERLEIEESIKWLHVEADPLFYNIGKLDYNPGSGEKEYFDLSCDFSILDVAKTANHGTKLRNEPIGTIIQVTDPDGDRLIICEITSANHKTKLQALGIEHLNLGNTRLLSIYTPNQSFLMTMDFHAKQLKAAGLWEKHPRFIIKTTPSAMAWDEWANANQVSVVNVPVGFKEIGAMLNKIEKQMLDNPHAHVRVKDIYGGWINLGVQPRLLFAGEESGGMITGPEEFMKSHGNRTAIAMREKSAGESMILLTALAARCKRERFQLSDYLNALFVENSIVAKFDIRKDRLYYNESDANPSTLKAEKLEGETHRDKCYLFFLGLAIAMCEDKITLEQTQVILSNAFPSLDFTNLVDVRFVGDGAYFKFTDKFVEIRKSGTDAKMKAYASGNNKANCRRFAKSFVAYSGNLTNSYKRDVSVTYLESVEERADRIYQRYQLEDI